MIPLEVIADRLDDLREPEMATSLRTRIVVLASPSRIYFEFSPYFRSNPAEERIAWVSMSWDVGGIITAPVLGYERVDRDDRFLVMLPGRTMAEFTFPAVRWNGFILGADRPPAMPPEFSSAFLARKAAGLC